MLPDDPRQVDWAWEQHVADDYRDDIEDPYHFPGIE